MRGHEMGSAKVAPSGRVMSAAEVAKHLIEACSSLSYFESFMFGSSLKGVGADFDLLFVGPEGDLLAKLKAELHDAGRELSLDVVFMSPSEASETEFVATTSCVSLWELADRPRSKPIRGRANSPS